MDEVKLTQLFVERSQTAAHMKEIDKQIEAAILELGESRKIAGVTATYYQPSSTTDYEGIAKWANAPKELIDRHSKETVTVSWKSVVDDLVIGDYPAEFSKDKPARVVIK